MNTRTLTGVGSIAVVALTVGAALLAARSGSMRQIGPNTASPAYIVVKTPTVVTFTSVIADSSLKKHDPKKVLLVRTDGAGTPTDILGRLNDRGKRADSSRNDHTYTIQVTLNEPAVGQLQFRIAAKFKDVLFKGNGNDDEDWDKDLAALNDVKARGNRRDRLPPLLRKLQHYALSDLFQVLVDPFTLPPDPGASGKQTLGGIDFDHDGIRDDVQRHIGLTYYSSRPLFLASGQYARSIQAMLIATNTVSAANAHIRSIHRALDCLYSLGGYSLQKSVSDDILKKMLDTTDRQSAWTSRNSQLTGIFELTPPALRGAQCQ